jgi:hypothetical protein
MTRPSRRGVRRHIHVEDAVREMSHHDKHVEKAEGRREYHTELTGHDGLSVVAHKGPPTLRLNASTSGIPQARVCLMSMRVRGGGRARP